MSKANQVGCDHEEHGPECLSVEAVGIEHRAIRLIQTILERFHGQVSMKTRPKNTRETLYQTFL